MTVREDIHGQLISGLEEAEFPIESPEALLNAFPEGADTTCESGDVELKAADAGELLSGKDFPFRSAEQVADTILDRAELGR